jgi:hypothetical protein
MTWLGTLLGQGLLREVGGLARILIGDREARDAAIAQEQHSASAELAAEFRRPAGNTVWHGFVDGLNRLPRPLVAFAVIGLLIYAPIDPIGFTLVMQAYAVVPEWLALLFAQIILLYFGGRMLDKWSGRLKPVDPGEIVAMAEGLRRLQSVRTAEPVAAAKATDDSRPATDPGADTGAETDNPPRSRSNPSIDAWRLTRHPESERRD